MYLGDLENIGQVIEESGEHRTGGGGSGEHRTCGRGIRRTQDSWLGHMENTVGWGVEGTGGWGNLKIQAAGGFGKYRVVLGGGGGEGSGRYRSLGES